MAGTSATGFAVFLLALSLAGGGGYGVGRWLGNPPSAPTSGDATAEDPAPLYVDAGQLVVPVLGDDGTRAFILSKITLEAGDPAAAERLRRELPRARDALLQGLFQMAGDGVFDRKVVDPGAVAESLRVSLEGRLSGVTLRAVLMDRLLRQENNRRS